MPRAGRRNPCANDRLNPRLSGLRLATVPVVLKMRLATLTLPFAFSSGLNWSPVSAEECKRWGLGVDTATLPKASLTPGEKEIADTLQRYGKEWTDGLLKDLEGLS